MILKSDFNFSLLKITEDKKFIGNLVELNTKANNYGLTITENVAREIAVYRQAALIENERVELKFDAIIRLTSAFLQTRYINQEDFADTMGEIISLFYLIKTETENTISDDDLISIMLDTFQNNPCFGSLELMQSKGLEKILREYKFGDKEIWDGTIITPLGQILRDRNVEELLDYDEDWRE
jgi:hypothetical protein